MKDKFVLKCQFTLYFNDDFATEAMTCTSLKKVKKSD